MLDATRVAEIVAPVALLLAVLALVAVALLGRRIVRLRAPQVPRPAAAASGEDAYATVQDLRAELADLRADLADALRHVAVVRYDAFSDLGGRLSFSIALLDDGGDGLVLTSICGRSDARTYAKGVVAGVSEHPLSPEELEAIGHAARHTRPAVGGPARSRTAPRGRSRQS